MIFGGGGGTGRFPILGGGGGTGLNRGGGGGIPGGISGLGGGGGCPRGGGGMGGGGRLGGGPGSPIGGVGGGGGLACGCCFGSFLKANWRKNCFVSLFQWVQNLPSVFSTSRLGTYTTNIYHQVSTYHLHSYTFGGTAQLY